MLLKKLILKGNFMSNYHEKKQKLLTQIDTTKNKIEKLKTRRAQEIGLLAMNYQLEDLDDDLLKKHFEKIASSANKVAATNE